MDYSKRKKKINVGDLRHKIKIQHHVLKENEVHEEYKDWEDFSNPWTKIKSISNGSEKTEAGKDELTLDYEIEMRYRKGITTKMRVVYKDKIFKINHVDNVDELNIKLRLLCTLQEEGVKDNE